MVKSNAALKSVEPAINRDLLTKIAQGSVKFVNKDEAVSVGVDYDPPLIEVNLTQSDSSDSNKVLCRITTHGANYLQNEPKETKVVTQYAIIKNAVLPPRRRGGFGGHGAPQRYPFDSLEVGDTFFVPVSEKVPDPVKSLGSSISVANLRYAVDTGETRDVERSVRGAKNKLVLDENGKKIMETKTVPVLDFKRKFTIRGVQGGKIYGGYTAPSDGALIGRIK
jgi:hypothetical protein